MSRKYRNVFVECGYDPEEVNQRLDGIVADIFFGEEGVRFYEEDDLYAYVEDTGNHDVRTEGMSYAMMCFVQLNDQARFDKIWRFTKKYMFMEEGENAGYFAWSVGTDGSKNAYGPAPDGEEFFAMALFFAAHRWGNGEGIFNYEQEAKTLLSVCVHKGEDGSPGHPMWNPDNYLIKFVPGVEFSDPSYHLPHFYYYFAKWCNPEDRDFWLKAAQASRDYLVKSCHEETGLTAEYADYEGRPFKFNGGHTEFYSDSYRVAANIGLYHEWFGDDSKLVACVQRLQKFFYETVPDQWDYIYEIDGRRIDEKVLHPVGLLATIAMGSLATSGPISEAWVRRFYETSLREGERRYYDNFLYLFAWLALSGRYRIYE